MTNTEDPAYPDHFTNGEHFVYHGVTKREYFAAKAMAGLLAGNFVNLMGMEERERFAASESVAFADALIAELNKK